MGAMSAISLAIGALALLWLIIAAAVAILAARRFRLAETVLAVARANAALLEATPARPLLGRPDQRVEVDARLARDLGLKAAPGRLAELSGDNAGLDAEDLTALTAAIDAARV